MAAGANTQGAVTGNGSLSVEAGNIRNTDAVIVSGGTTRINSKEVHNIENGRIYGGKVAKMCIRDRYCAMCHDHPMS